MNYFCQLFVIYYNNLLLQVIRNSKLFIAAIYIYIYIIALRLLKYLKFIAFFFFLRIITTKFNFTNWKPFITYKAFIYTSTDQWDIIMA